MEKRAQRIPSWPGVIHSNKGRIHLGRPTCGVLKFRLRRGGGPYMGGLNLGGEVVVRKKFSRTQLLRFTANVHVGLIGMEACGGSHFLGRALREQRHEVRLIPAQYVKPYVKTNKRDYIAAKAITETVAR